MEQSPMEYLLDHLRKIYNNGGSLTLFSIFQTDNQLTSSIRDLTSEELCEGTGGRRYCLNDTRLPSLNNGMYKVLRTDFEEADRRREY
jgi:hypothetical protein